MTAERRFLFPIEAGQVLHFARAIGDPDPVFNDPDYGALAASGAVTPPPTFLIAADHYDPECPRRPAPGEAYPGSGRVLGGTGPNHSARPKGLHAQQVFEFHRPLRIGETLTVTVRPGRTWQRPGSLGTLSFDDTVTEYAGADGEPVATATWTRVEAPAATGQAPAGPPVAPAPADTDGSEGSTLPVVDDLTITQMVMYAGASGDLVALHHDNDIARAFGYPSAFAQGMLTFGLSSRAVSAILPPDRLTRISARMSAIVFPGDSLTTQARTTRADDSAGKVAIAFTTTNQRGAVVLTGAAEGTLGG